MAHTLAENSLIPYFISQSLILNLFIIRIDKTFARTDLEFSKCHSTSLYIIAIIMLLIVLWIAIVNIDHNDLDSEIMEFVELMTVFLWVISNVILSIILIVLFTKRIDKILTIRAKVQIRESIPPSKLRARSASIVPKAPNTSIPIQRAQTDPVIGKCHDTDTDSSILHQMKLEQVLKDNKLLYVVTKHSVLVPMAIWSKFIAIMGSAIIGGISEASVSVIFLLVIDALIQCLCIYLLFGFNDKIYYRLCSFCHLRCKKRKMKKVAKVTKPVSPKDVVMEIEMWLINSCKSIIYYSSIVNILK